MAVRLREQTRSPQAASYTLGELALDTATHSVRAAYEAGRAAGQARLGALKEYLGQ